MNTNLKLLVTGFEPFGGETTNPSWQIAKALDGERIGLALVHGCELPCVFGDALDVLDRAIHQHQPTLVLALVQAGGRVDFSLERVAINVDDARIADNAGRQPIDVPVHPDGPAAYFGTLPVKAMVAGLREAGYPASVSNSAGTFVCNHVFYGLQHRLRHTRVRSGFMHVPLLPEQVAKTGNNLASMPLETMVSGVRLALQIALLTPHDQRLAMGQLD